jgi:hypothetical protein
MRVISPGCGDFTPAEREQVMQAASFLPQWTECVWLRRLQAVKVKNFEKFPAALY